MPRKRSKIYRGALELFDRQNQYSLDEAMGLLKRMPNRKLDETVELAIRLGVDPRHADQQVRGTVILPHGLGKEVRVVVFAKGALAVSAQEAGADVVGAEDLVEKVSGGWTEFDIAVSAPDMMGAVGKLGRILGPRGLMPNPKSGTVTQDLERAVKEAKAGRVEFRVDRGGSVHSPIGKISFEEDKLLENANALIDVISRARPASAKGQYIRSATLSTTMGPGIRLSRTGFVN